MGIKNMAFDRDGKCTLKSKIQNCQGEIIMLIIGQIRILPKLLDPDPVHFTEVGSGSGSGLIAADPKLCSPFIYLKNIYK
jgi:hypothetical protein